MSLVAKAGAIKQKLAQRHELRKRLRAPAALSYAISDSIAMLNAEAWRAVTAQAGFFLSYDYLATIEAVLPGNLSPRYALIYEMHEDGPQVVAAVVMQIADIRLAQARPAKASTESRRASPLDLIAEKAVQRVLTCGNLLTYGQHGVAFAEGVDHQHIWHGVAEVLYRVRQAEKLVGKTHFVMIKDIHAPYVDAARHLTHLSYRHVETQPNMVLALQAQWKSYDDYLASLTSKYRSNIRNLVIKPIDEAGLVLQHLDDWRQAQEELFALYKAVQVNAGFRPFELRPEYFPALQKAAGGRALCSVIRQGEALLGFLITLADGDTAVAYHIGMDRAASTAHPIYLRLLHAGIADALALGCKRVSFGRTALEPKAALGAKAEPFGILLRHRQPVLNKLIKHLLLGIEHEDAPDRNPFKKPA